MNKEKIIYLILSGVIAAGAGIGAIIHSLPSGKKAEIRTVSSVTQMSVPDITAPVRPETRAVTEPPAVTDTEVTSVSTTEESSIVNLNTADKEKLMTLKGIGEKKAMLIIEYREIHNGFSCVEEITEVRGIGEKTLERLRPDICV